jgi:hypothetical protein
MKNTDSLYPELKARIDELCDDIVAGRVSTAEAEDRMKAIRIWATEVIPYQMEAYDLIYENRFHRLLEQFKQK